ncbi:MAG: hypothetical protein KKA67_00045 [Spirochaetes bacterium]|nr:hypothetical protein [Spirochaetota bacterium]MBU1082124.1 hypothetical protein [Spirochaetota bacterium]
MDRREYISNLARSPLGLASAGAALIAGAAAWASIGPVAGILLAAGSLAALAGVETVTGLGSKAASAEAARRAWASSRRYLAEAKERRTRLATMRVPDPEVKALLELAATRGSAYLTACETARSRDPLAEEALADCVSLADLYLKELDGASTERRYGLEDADPFADAKARTVAALIDRAAVIANSTLALSGGLSPADAMDVKERL